VCTVSYPEEREASREEAREGSSFATSEQTAVPRTELGAIVPQAPWIDLPVTPGQCTGHRRGGGRAGSWQAAEEKRRGGQGHRATAVLTVCGVAVDPTDGQPLVPLEAGFRPIAPLGRS
jgi:hypothetical protein